MPGRSALDAGPRRHRGPTRQCSAVGLDGLGFIGFGGFIGFIGFIGCRGFIGFGVWRLGFRVARSEEHPRFGRTESRHRRLSGSQPQNRSSSGDWIEPWCYEGILCSFVKTPSSLRCSRACSDFAPKNSQGAGANIDLPADRGLFSNLVG